MANSFRNEVQLILGSNTYTVRGTFAAIAEIEETFDAGISWIIMSKLTTFKIGLVELKKIIMAGLKAAKSTYSVEQLENDMLDAGVPEVISQVTKFLSSAVEGAPKVEKNE